MNNIFKYLLWTVLISLISGQLHAALRVETTTQDLAAIAKVIGGQHIEVHSLTSGTRDPHFAVAKPSMIRRVFRADLLLVIGADMEIGWLPPLLQSSRNSRVQPGNPGYLDLSEVVTLLGKVQGSISRAMGDVHAKGNPHYWLDPHNGIQMAKAITGRLTQLDPGHAIDYTTNFNAFKSKINSKLPDWKKALQHLKGKPVITYHNSFVYLANAFDFNIIDEIEPIPGIAPSASSLSSLITEIKTKQIDLLLIEPYYERRSAQYLKQQTGIQVAVIPQSVGAQSNIQNYVDLFDSIIDVLQLEENN